MANAAEVLKHTIRDASLLVSSASASAERPHELQTLLELAQVALAAGDGEVADDLLRQSALHAVTLQRLGVPDRAASGRGIPVTTQAG
jgi:soluble P-type ATPase